MKRLPLVGAMVLLLLALIAGSALLAVARRLRAADSISSMDMGRTAFTRRT